MSFCDSCEATRRRQIADVSKRYGIQTGVSEMTHRLHDRIQLFYPLLFDILLNKQRFRAAPSLIPLNPMVMANLTYGIDVVDAPLVYKPSGFVAICSRIPAEGSCSRCNKSIRSVALNIRFQVLTSHLLYAASTGDFSLLKDIWIAVSNDDLSAYNKVSPPSGLELDIVWSGIAWVLFHELGHVAGNRKIEKSYLASVGVRSEVLDFVAEELEADQAALNSMIFASMAANGPGAPLDAIFIGVELVLRTLSLVQFHKGRYFHLLDELPLTLGTYPSAKLRLRFVEDLKSLLLDMGFLNGAAFDKRRTHLFRHWNEAVKGLR